MPPFLALFLWFVLLVGLFWFDPARDRGVSAALWVPLIWMFIVGSRLPSQWLGGQVGTAAEALEEGNSLDRSIYVVLILLAVGILMTRSFTWSDLVACNLALSMFLSYALLSTFWSDYAFITFKRWFRDLGSYLMILIVLSDPRPLDAIRTLLRRLCFLLIPLSIVLIKYYPDFAKHYDGWSGVATYAGATTSKNMLGVACLISGIFFFWDTLTRWSHRKNPQTGSIIRLNIVFIAMTLWLLNTADSATSRLCLALGCLVIAATHSKLAVRRPAVLKVLIPIAICSLLLLEFGFGLDLKAELAVAVGRDPTLTGRSVIWDAVLSIQPNMLLGTGYESFWLGDRIQGVWQLTGMGSLNNAHNGYLELYLNLGLVGLFLLAVFLAANYRTICRRLTERSPFASLSLALWTVLLFYNFTEAAFKSQLMWVIFLLAAIVVPRTKTVPGASRSEALSIDNPVSRWRNATV